MRGKQIHIGLLVILMGVLSLPVNSWGQLSPSQFDYPHNHLPWYTVVSPNFEVHFQKGNSRSARVTAHIAENIYSKITALYNHRPDTKVDIVLRDRQDYSNGAAYFFDNQIDIWVPALNSKLRGTHDWLWDVITHEFTHIVQLQKSMKKSRNLPAIYFQWLSYSDVRRPDVLYGYPKALLTYPFASINVPAWFAEGVAQYQRSQLYHDFWDSHRDMLLRTSLLYGDPIAYDEMAFFNSKNALERERIYNQGFAFTTYLATRFGESILPEISKALGQSGIFTMESALKKTTDISGKKLFQDFLEYSRSEYKNAVAELTFQSADSVASKGFFNFYPEVNASGERLAYLSNKLSRSSNTHLFIKSLSDSSSQESSINVGKPNTSNYSSTHSYGQEPVIARIQSAFSFSPDGDSIVFSRQTLNRYGERYNDLYLYDITSQKEKRLTESARLTSPAWHPSDQKVVAVQQTAGSSNLTEITIQTGSLKPLTDYSDGEQTYTPSWHPDGQQIYFARADAYSRNIFRYNYKSGNTEAVLQDTLIDYRDPHIGDIGKYLYFAADPDGIFNIYRVPLAEPNAAPEKLTSVQGGAFMPHVSNGVLYFSEFTFEGYQISSTSLQSADNRNFTGSYNLGSTSGFKLLKEEQARDRADLDYLSAIPSSELTNLSPSDSLVLDISRNNSDRAFLRKYDNNYTDFTFYPVIRFDNYSNKYGSNGRLLTAARFGDLGRNLLRDMKLGSYFNSRDVTGKLSIFGGAMFGLASEPANGLGDFFSPSRLTDLDRDLFLTAEYRGLPFIEKRWSPTISIELYNLRRNVDDELTIEEFPCTACLPDTTKVDIAYNVWEANLYLRSKFNQHNLIELGVGYSPYKVQTDNFYSRELKQLIPSSSSEYFRGTTITSAHIYENFTPYPNSDVAPIGLRTLFRYSYEPSKLLDDYKIEGNTLSPVYKSVTNHSLEASVRYGYPIAPHSALTFYSRGFSYLNQPDNFFYLDYIGGFTGMRSYPYFAIGGNTTAMAKLSYVFPLIRNIDTQVGRHSLDKLYLRLFGEAGNGWGGPLKIGDNIKTGLGAELRFAFNSYYLFPLKLFVSGSYGFNDFDVRLPDEFITKSDGGRVPYGNELLFHFGLTFDFNVLNHD